MAFNILDFRNKIRSVGLPQYFVVRIPQIGDEATMTALARTTEMPQVQHNTQEIPFRGLPMKIDTIPVFAEWTVTFLCDEAHTARHLFLKWNSSSYSVQRLSNNGHNTYKRDNVSVSQISYAGDPISTAVFYGIWPTTVGNVTLDQAGGNAQTFQVTFTYDYFLMNDVAGQTLPSDVDIKVDNNGKMAINVQGVAGLSYNL